MARGTPRIMLGIGLCRIATQCTITQPRLGHALLVVCLKEGVLVLALASMELLAFIGEGADPAFVHKRHIDGGSSGEVHEVFLDAKTV